MREQIAAARATPAHSEATDRRLLAAACKNPYERALLLMQMARQRMTASEQVSGLLHDTDELAAQKISQAENRVRGWQHAGRAAGARCDCAARLCGP